MVRYLDVKDWGCIAKTRRHRLFLKDEMIPRLENLGIISECKCGASDCFDSPENSFNFVIDKKLKRWRYSPIASVTSRDRIRWYLDDLRQIRKAMYARVHR